MGVYWESNMSCLKKLSLRGTCHSLGVCCLCSFIDGLLVSSLTTNVPDFSHGRYGSEANSLRKRWAIQVEKFLAGSLHWMPPRDGTLHYRRLWTPPWWLMKVMDEQIALEQDPELPLTHFVSRCLSLCLYMRMLSDGHRAVQYVFCPYWCPVKFPSYTFHQVGVGGGGGSGPPLLMATAY